MRKGFGGADLTTPINRIVGKVASALNVRGYWNAAFTLRNPLTDAIIELGGVVRTIARLNDTTPAGPVAGFTLISSDADGVLYNNATLLAQHLSGDPLSMVPFRPNASVQPWMYVGDKPQTPTGSITYATIDTEFLIDGTPTTFDCSGMVKVRSDGLIYKMGIKEPQTAPTVTTAGTTTTGTISLPANTPPWTNTGGLNASFNYGQTTAPGTGGVGGIVFIPLPPGAQTVQLIITGTATVNGASHLAGDSGPSGPTFPGAFSLFAPPTIALAAFTDGSGVVLAAGGPHPTVVAAGLNSTWNVPAGATQIQLGIDSDNATFPANTDAYSVAWAIVTSAVATVISTMGDVTTYIYGDSPHTGPVADYIWKNPSDIGSGIARTSGEAVSTATNNSWEFDSSPEDGTVPVQWNTLDSSGTVTGSIPLFTPALETEGYQDFNCCVVGSIFVPTAGSYSFTLQYKDQIMLGFSAGATLLGTVAITGGGHAPGTQTGPFFGFKGQSKTVISDLPLLYVGRVDGTTATSTFQVATFTVTFAASGAYQVEIDWDYWSHSGRSLIFKQGGTSIPPLPSGVRTNVSYRPVFRSSATGAVSNPGPASTPQLTPVLDNTVVCEYSPDPQVDKVDWYRQDSGLPNYTYVATGPNTNPPTPIVDSLSDIAVAANPILQFDNFEPFPSIDLPKSGVIDVTGGVITWVSGDVFNIRWLAGTVILIGSPTQLAYTLYSRPTSTTSMTIPSVPDGTNLVYNIAEPILAAQPLAYLFGPTDNINFTFGVGDPLRPGTLYWCKGSNLDSAPDTNQMDVTDPSEPLINGCMSGGRAVLFSDRRGWVIMPNFFNAEATATGTSGSTWTTQASSIPRGLFIPRCLAISGGGTIFFRVDDGIHVSPGGLGSESITDGDLYPLFAHEGSTPQSVERNGVTWVPPDDSKPELQQFQYNLGYLYYSYTGLDNLPYTIVFDEAAQGWILDSKSPEASTYASNEGESVQGLYVGCVDNTIRQMASSGSETPLSGKLLTPAIGGQGFMYAQEVTVEYSSNDVVRLDMLAADTNNGSYGPDPIFLPSTNGIIAKTKFLVGANKWKLAWFQFSNVDDPTMKVFTEGFTVRCKNWGTKEPYKQLNPFEETNPYFPRKGGEGGQN